MTFSAWASSMKEPSPVSSRRFSAAITANAPVAPLAGSMWNTEVVEVGSASWYPRSAVSPDSASKWAPKPT